MSDRPKRERRAPQRYEPQEIPVDDYDDEYETGEDAAGVVEVSGEGANVEGRDYRKRYKGEFDELDDEDEEDLDEPDEYEVNDGFVVPDDFEESNEDRPPTEDEEEEFSDDDEDDDEDYDEDEDDEASNVDEPDVAEPE